MKTILTFSMLSFTWLSGSLALGAKGIADLKPTSDQYTLSGTVDLTDVKEGLSIKVIIKDAPTGDHGFHIHEFGSCDDSGKAAGGHYNPRNTAHGHVVTAGPAKAHAGDLGNLTIGLDGTGTLDAVIPGLSLANSRNTAAGRAFILHEKADDFGQPLGNAGGRIGCGTIRITGN